MRTDGVRRSSIVLSAGDNHGERRDPTNALHARPRRTTGISRDFQVRHLGLSEAKRIRAYPSGRTAIDQRVKACAAILLESSMNIREINHELGGS
jgi:hypothetical protein